MRTKVQFLELAQKSMFFSKKKFSMEQPAGEGVHMFKKYFKPNY